MVKKIKLTQRKVTLVDDEDYKYLSQWKWFARETAGIFYASRNSKKGELGYVDRDHRQLIHMHRIIINTPQQMVTDHIDHDGLNNQKRNLRIVSPRQNNQNQNRITSSKYPGVSYYKAYGKWQAMIAIGKDRIFLGYFDSEIEAAKAYEKAVREKCNEELICKMRK